MTTAYAPDSEKERRHDDSDGLTTAMFLDLPLPFIVLDDKVLTPLAQHEVGGVSAPVYQLKRDGNGTTDVDSGRCGNDDGVSTCLGCKSSTHRCS